MKLTILPLFKPTAGCTSIPMDVEMEYSDDVFAHSQEVYMQMAFDMHYQYLKGMGPGPSGSDLQGLSQSEIQHISQLAIQEVSREHQVQVTRFDDLEKIKAIAANMDVAIESLFQSSDPVEQIVFANDIHWNGLSKACGIILQIGGLATHEIEEIAFPSTKIDVLHKTCAGMVHQHGLFQDLVTTIDVLAALLQNTDIPQDVKEEYVARLHQPMPQPTSPDGTPLPTEPQPGSWHSITPDNGGPMEIDSVKVEIDRVSDEGYISDFEPGPMKLDPGFDHDQSLTASECWGQADQQPKSLMAFYGHQSTGMLTEALPQPQAPPAAPAQTQGLAEDNPFLRPLMARALPAASLPPPSPQQQQSIIALEQQMGSEISETEAVLPTTEQEPGSTLAEQTAAAEEEELRYQAALNIQIHMAKTFGQLERFTDDLQSRIGAVNIEQKYLVEAHQIFDEILRLSEDHDPGFGEDDAGEYGECVSELLGDLMKAFNEDSRDTVLSDILDLVDVVSDVLNV